MARSSIMRLTILVFLCLSMISSSHADSSYLDLTFDGGGDDDLSFYDRPFISKPQNLSFEATSSTSVMIRWDPPFGVNGYKIKYRVKNGNKKQETVHLNSQHNYYELKNLEKATNYNVKIAAIFGNDTGPFTEWHSVETLATDLDETQVPGKPSSLRAKAGSNSIFLYWTPPKTRNVVVKGYMLGWGIGIPDVQTMVLEGDIRSYTIEKLLPSFEYVISLRAFNRMGEGPPTYESVKTLAESSQEAAVEILPPVGLKATVLSSTGVMLDWSDAPRDPVHPDNRWYLVRYTSNLHSSSPKYRYLNTSKVNCMIEDLKPNTQYEFAVKVLRNKQNSTWSMSVLNTTHEAVPSTPPRDLTVVASSEEDPGTINLHWQPPKQPNGQITGYVIFYTTDNTQQERDWIVKVIIGDKLNAVLNGLQPSSVYYFKIQARNNKGYGPLSAEVYFKTLSVMPKMTSSSVSTISISLYMVVVLVISIIALILLVALLRVYLSNRSKSSMKNRKGYLPAATSPASKNINSKLNNTRELKPPDLWIHHNEQVELKSIDKGNESPMIMRTNDNSFAKIKKTNSTYGMNSSLYDDINKGSVSPVDNMGIATMRRSSTIRAKPPSCLDHTLSNGMINMEPSTAISRPLYPKTQFNITRNHMNLDSIDSAMSFSQNGLHLYDPVAGSGAHMALTSSGHPQESGLVNMSAIGSSGHSYMSGNSSSSPHSVVSNNTVLTNSSATTNITNSSTSPPNTSIYMSNKRPPGPSLKSFGLPTPPPPLPSLATLSNLQNNSHNNIYNTSLASIGSPNKKFLLTTTNNLNGNMCGSNSTLASNGKSATHFSDDNSISASFNADDLNQEMANLDSLMKDLNAMKPHNGMGSC